jgi:hypothetical protein
VAVRGNFLEEPAPVCETSAIDQQYTKIEAQTGLMPSVRMLVAMELVGLEVVGVAAMGMVAIVGAVGVAVDVARVAVRTRQAQRERGDEIHPVRQHLKIQSLWQREDRAGRKRTNQSSSTAKPHCVWPRQKKTKSKNKMQPLCKVGLQNPKIWVRKRQLLVNFV